MIEYLFSLFFPETCYSCQTGTTALCTACASRIPRSGTIEQHPYALALYHYGDRTVQKAIWDLKYSRKSSLAKALVLHDIDSIVEYVSNLLQSPQPCPIVLVPVPQHYRKTLSRGFNQSRLVAKWIQRAIPEATVTSLLRKNIATAAQASTASRTQREHNLHGSMSVEKKYGKLDPRTLYIVCDDVITTGSTITETSRALRAAGAKHIRAIAIAHGYRH